MRLELVGLRKSYGARLAVSDLTMTIEPGEVTCLIGRNGAGKTTTMEMALGLRAPDDGQVVLGGRPLPPVELGGSRASFSYLPETTVLFDHLTGREHLVAMAAQLGCARPGQVASDLVDELGLSDDADRACRLLSLGTRRRVALGLALIGDPAAVFLDEPTANLDPFAVATVKRLVTTLRAQGRLVLVSTHDLDFASQVGDRFALMADGYVRVQGSLDELRRALRMEQASLEEMTLSLPVHGHRAGSA